MADTVRLWALCLFAALANFNAQPQTASSSGRCLSACSSYHAGASSSSTLVCQYAASGVAIGEGVACFPAYNCRDDWTVCVPTELGDAGLDGHVMSDLGNQSAVAAACAEILDLPKGGTSFASPPETGWTPSALGWHKGTGNVGCGWGSTYSNVHPTQHFSLEDFGRIEMPGFSGAEAEVACCIEAMKFEGSPISHGGAAVRFDVYEGTCRIDRELFLRGNLDASSGKPMSQLMACGADTDTYYWRHASGAADAANLASAGRCALWNNFTQVRSDASLFTPKGALPHWDAELPNHACNGAGELNTCAQAIVYNNINTAESCCEACATLQWLAESGNGGTTLSDGHNPCVAFQIVRGRCQILRESWFQRYAEPGRGRHAAGQHAMGITEVIHHCAGFENHDACARADDSHGSWDSCSGWGLEHFPNDCAYYSSMYYRDPGCQTPGGCPYAHHNSTEGNVSYIKIQPIPDAELLAPSNSSELRCPPGAYLQSSSESQDQSAPVIVCMDCRPGTFSATEGASTCLSCPIGTFNPVHAATACATCPSATYNEVSGATHCLECEASKTSPPGSTSAGACELEVPPEEVGATCPPTILTGLRDLAEDRRACVARCNDAGFCCTNDNGGCGSLPCAAGCLLAFYSPTEEECVAECEAGNLAGCEYLHAASSTIFRTCGSHEECGCPAQGEAGYVANWGASNDCSAAACAAGCSLAANVPGHSFYGRELSPDEIAGKNASTAASQDALDQAMSAIMARLTSADLPDSDAALAEQVATFVEKAMFLSTSPELISKVFTLIETYETQPPPGDPLAARRGPLFVSRGYFPRSSSSGAGVGGLGEDGRGMDRAMLAVQQAVLDELYNAAEVKVGLPACSGALYQGRRWKTAQHFPGDVAPPSDPSLVHAITIDADVAAVWGVPVAFAKDAERRPTGLYLAPGQVARVLVPAAMIGTGFKVLVGAHTSDNSNKGEHRRLDRVSATFHIVDRVTLVSNPLGGGIYVLVPYLAQLGLVTVQISGGVVRAPFFQRTKFLSMTNDDWQARRSAPAPWADFETDKFMLNVPRSWVYALEDAVGLMRDYDTAMDGASEWGGFAPEVRNRKVLYLQNDLHIKHGAYGVGYPQVNTLYDPARTYDGNHDHWLVRNPTGWPVCYHELGHAQLLSQYRGETEAIINFMFTYIRHVKFGDDFDKAFSDSMDHTGYIPDDAAVHWMITPNFRNGREMDHSNTEHDEFRYQMRGYAKYADLVRLFGWETYTTFYHQENLDYMAACPGAEHGCCLGGHMCIARGDGLSDVDSRTLRLSIAAGEDVSALIHFWGIHPVDLSALRQELAGRALSPSVKVRCLLQRYKTLIPRDNAEFNVFFEKIHPGRVNDGSENPLYGRGWYNVWRDAYNITHAEAARRQVDEVLSLYYPATSGDSCEGVATGAPGEPWGGSEVERPSTYAWMQAAPWRVRPIETPVQDNNSSYQVLNLEWIVNVTFLESRNRRNLISSADASVAPGNANPDNEPSVTWGTVVAREGGGEDSMCARIAIFNSSEVERDLGSGVLVMRKEAADAALPVVSSNVVCSNTAGGMLVMRMNESSHPVAWMEARTRASARQSKTKAGADRLMLSADSELDSSLVASFECIGAGKDLCDMTVLRMQTFVSRAAITSSSSSSSTTTTTTDTNSNTSTTTTSSSTTTTTCSSSWSINLLLLLLLLLQLQGENEVRR